MSWRPSWLRWTSERGGALLETVDRSERAVISFRVELNRQVKSAVEYVVRMKPGVRSPDGTLRLGKGSCRDSAWLLVGLLRSLGLAARFASGYLIRQAGGPPGTGSALEGLRAGSRQPGGLRAAPHPYRDGRVGERARRGRFASGRFVGPASQAPRMDEGRRDAIYEMGIAFQRTPSGEGAPPWLTDRLFRHLLVDGTGNTHRAELCIDKLFSPDTASGRQGLVELRAFEMPPHAQMSAAAQLPLRALAVAFWKKPYDAPLIRRDTRIHDRFLLPHFVRWDFDGVLDLLSTAGFHFRDDVFAPHFEFRFPLVGETEGAPGTFSPACRTSD